MLAPRKSPFWRQARRVVVECAGQAGTLPDGRRCHDVHAQVTNASPDPIAKARLQLVVGDGSWGPQLLGSLVPWQRVAVTARIITDASPENTNAFVRFVDVEGRPWVANARTTVERDERPVDEWIESGRAFAQRQLSVEERGTVEGMNAPPDFDAWRAQLAERKGEGWTPTSPPK